MIFRTFINPSTCHCRPIKRFTCSPVEPRHGGRATRTQFPQMTINPPQDLTVEPHEGGQIWETTHDGTRTPWARITEWPPPDRFLFNWYVGRSEENATFVTFAFSRIGSGTRVDLVHSQFARISHCGAMMAAGYCSGWDVVLGQCFAGQCQKHCASLNTFEEV